MKKANQLFALLVYWSSVLQSVIRCPHNCGLYVLSYPKSGSNWMSSMLSAYFDIPVLEPWKERWPVIARRIYHMHRILPFRLIDRRTVYVVRDGRDVIVSYYFEMVRSPHAVKIKGEFEKHIGRKINETDLVEVLGNFIEFLHTYRRASVRYDKHLNCLKKHNFIVVKYEALRSDTQQELGRIVYELTGKEADSNKVREAVDLNSIDKVRTVENAYFVRKGEPGNWRQYFTKDSAQKFWSYYGDAMMAVGYESNTDWISSLPS